MLSNTEEHIVSSNGRYVPSSEEDVEQLTTQRFRVFYLFRKLMKQRILHLLVSNHAAATSPQRSIDVSLRRPSQPATIVPEL
jgi:hypothetical protein